MYKKLLSFSRKEENKELIIHSLISLTIRVAGAGATFLMNVIIARELGAAEAGYFFLGVTVITILASIGRIGADQTVLRFVSIYSEQQKWDKVQAVIRIMMKWSFLTTIVLTALVCVFAGPLAVHVFNKPGFEWPLFWCALSIPFFAGYSVLGMALQGRKKVLLSVVILRIAVSLFFVLSLIFYSPANGTGASILYLIASAATLAAAYYGWHKNTPKAEGTFDAKMLWKSSSAIWVYAIMQQLVVWGGQFVAGIFNSPQEVAQLAAARSTSMLMLFVMSAINYVSAPRFATMYNEGKMEQLKKYARNTTRILTITALPMILVILLFPSYIMNLFGKGFKEGAELIRILALGQFINVITGSVSYLLIMSGHEKDIRNISIVSGILSLTLAFILNPLFGAMGSAIATAVAVATSNLLAVGLVKKRLGFSMLSILGFK